MIQQLTETTGTSTSVLPKVGWIREHKKTASRGKRKEQALSWVPETSGPYLVPVTRWIE